MRQPSVISLLVLGLLVAGRASVPASPFFPSFLGSREHSPSEAEVDAFFDTIAIRVKPGDRKQFLVGDNLAGYFEGFTQDYRRGAGYLMKNTTLFATYATFTGGKLNDRRAGDSLESVFPCGHLVVYPNRASEEMVLHSRKYALSLAAHSASPETLGVLPLLKCPLDSVEVKYDHDAIVISPKAVPANPPYPPFIALCADRKFSLSTGLDRAPADVARLPGLSARDLVLFLASKEPVTNFTVTVAFGFTADEALKKAREIVRSNPVAAEKRQYYDYLTRSLLWTDDPEYNRALIWAKAASHLFVVEEFGQGIWAGLPWFKNNWGRDTFISLPGTLLVSGAFDEARDVLENFAKFQKLGEGPNYGRIPNLVNSPTDIIYNTTDGTPWMIREAFEYLRYTGDKDFTRKLYPVIQRALDGAITNYVDADGFLTHDDADTWMDARIDGRQPWSARGNRAVEIQALWYTALQAGVALANESGDETSARRWAEQAAALKSNFTAKFWDGHVMADRLRPDGSRDVKVRPNQLTLLSVPFEDRLTTGEVEARVLSNAVSELLYPYGIASLSQNDPYFHPVHENWSLYHKDAAYHNGTVWGWNAGFTVTALDRFGCQDLAYCLATNLGRQLLYLGTLGNMSELLNALPDEQGHLHPSGTFAQTWSVAEYSRNGYQDFLGFRPNLLENRLVFMPAIPRTWNTFRARLPFGRDETLEVSWKRSAAGERWSFVFRGHAARSVTMNLLAADIRRRAVAFSLVPEKEIMLEFDEGTAQVNGQRVPVGASQPSYASLIGALKFQTPKVYRPATAAADFPMLRGKDMLKGIVERGEFH